MIQGSSETTEAQCCPPRETGGDPCQIQETSPPRLCLPQNDSLHLRLVRLRMLVFKSWGQRHQALSPSPVVPKGWIFLFSKPSNGGSDLQTFTTDSDSRQNWDVIVASSYLTSLCFSFPILNRSACLTGLFQRFHETKDAKNLPSGWPLAGTK